MSDDTRFSRRTLLSGLAASVLTRAIPAWSDCAPPTRGVHLHTPLTSPLPQGATFLISHSALGGVPSALRVANFGATTGSLVAGASTIPLAFELITTGLGRLRPTTAVPPGVYTLNIAPGFSAQATFGTARLPTPPSAPVISALTAVRIPPSRHQFGAPTTGIPMISAQLSTRATAQNIAAACSWGTATGRQPALRSYGLLTTGTNTVTPLVPPGDCEPYVPDLDPPLDGMSLWCQVVDHFGQVSAASRPFGLRFTALPTRPRIHPL